MQRKYFLKTDRIGFSIWNQEDFDNAKVLWGDFEVTRYISLNGIWTIEDIKNRLHTEMTHQSLYQVQYWPIFELSTNELIGCCGLRPYKKNEYEIGFHLRPMFWNKGYATESAKAVIQYAFTILKAKKIIAGHHPLNIKSQHVLKKLGFIYIGDKYYEPTKLYHPSYQLDKYHYFCKGKGLK